MPLCCKQAGLLARRFCTLSEQMPRYAEIVLLAHIVQLSMQQCHMTISPLTGQFHEVMQAEFEDICEEAQLWTKLQDLEQLCQEQGLLDGQDDAVR